MNIKQIEQILIEGEIEPNEARIEAKMLVKHYLKVDDKFFILNAEFECDEWREILLEKAKFRAQTRTPIQHIIGTADFMGEKFIVNENVLIPRDETEMLVKKAVEILNDKLGIVNSKLSLRETSVASDEAIQDNSFGLPRHLASEAPHNDKHSLVLDIGTGSGCIACTIAKLTDAQVLGVDISTDALQIALENSSKMGLFNKAIFRKSDIFSNIHSDEKFDLIVSNPPYIPPSERGKLQKEVEFDPELALFTKDDAGIEFYDRIIKEAPDYINENGYLLFELGIGQADKVKLLMEQRGFKDIGVEKDLAGIERIIWGRK